MAVIHQAWSILTVATSMLAQLCIGQKSCTIWSSAGSVVNRESSFKVYCTFSCKCKKSIYVNSPDKPQYHKELNSTTIYLDVMNITESRTYSCDCINCRTPLDPCGLDIIAGYPPDRPGNIKCIQYVEEGLVECNWNRGRDTYLMNSSKLGVRTTSGNHTVGPMFYTGSSKGSDLLTATFNVSSSIEAISVHTSTENKLGTAESLIFNFTLADIVMLRPPVLSPALCASRSCEIKLIPSQRNKQIEYRTEQQDWMLYQESGGPMSSAGVQSISSLEPYTLYYFRARIKCRTGLWSRWSANISSWTEEERPDQKLDVWFSKSDSESDSMTVYWKKLSESNARGKILEYIVTLNNTKTGSVSSERIAADVHYYMVQSCASCCQVTVFARNSKGWSHPATIPMPSTIVMAPEEVRAVPGNDSITISWRKPASAFLPTGYLVEWYPRGQKLEALQWVRLAGNESGAVIASIEHSECYEGTVYVLNGSSFGMARFMGVNTLKSALAVGPSVKCLLKGNIVTVTWTEVHGGGCITNYTIYIQNNSTSTPHLYQMPASEGIYVIKDLSPDWYRLWITAWTMQGEGPPGECVNFLIEHISQNNELLLFIILISVCCVALCCSCVISHQSIMPDVIDPANSKWARQCPHDKGKINLQVKLNDSTPKEEDEPNIADVEELVKFCPTSGQGKFNVGVSSNLTQASLSSEAGPVTRLNSQTSYIKSLSHDSDSSENTHSSQDTTVGYISTHEPEHVIGDEEDKEENLLSFFPSCNVCMDSVVFGGPLTLDAVKIDYSDCWENG